jgi:hypothetical protein
VISRSIERGEHIGVADQRGLRDLLVERRGSIASR